MDAGEFNGHMLYSGLRLDYRPRLWAPTSASRAISAVAELLVAYNSGISWAIFTLFVLYQWKQELVLYKEVTKFTISP